MALHGRVLINEATGQVGGYGFGQGLTKHLFYSQDIAQLRRLWYNAVAACASEHTHSSFTPRFFSPKRYKSGPSRSLFKARETVIQCRYWCLSKCDSDLVHTGHDLGVVRWVGLAVGM